MEGERDNKQMKRIAAREEKKSAVKKMNQADVVGSDWEIHGELPTRMFSHWELNDPRNQQYGAAGQEHSKKNEQITQRFKDRDHGSVGFRNWKKPAWQGQSELEGEK